MISLFEHIMQLGWVLLLIVGPLPILGWLTPRLAALDGWPERVIAYLSAWCAVQMVLGQALGYLGIFRLEAVLGVYAGLWVAAGVLQWRNRASIGALRRASIRDWRSLFIGVGLAVLGVGLATKLIVQPVTEYDSLNYHLPAIAQWYSTGSLTLDKWGLANYYPYGWEVLGGLVTLMLGGDDAFVLLPNLLAWSLLGLTVGTLAWRLCRQAVVAVSAAAVIMTTPIVLECMLAVRVDVALAAFFLAGVVFVWRYQTTRQVILLALTALMVGLIVGVKSSGLVYGALLIGWAAIATWRQRALSVRAVVQVGGLAAVLIVVVGGSWYVRNWLDVGNPLAPVQISFGTQVLLPGSITQSEVARSTLAALFDISNSAHRQILAEAIWKNLGGLLLLWASVGVVGVVALVMRRADIRWRVIGISGLMVLAAGLFWFTPYGADNGSHGWQITPWVGQALRYGLPFWGLVCALGAASLAPWPRFAGGLAAIGVSAALLNLSPVWLLMGWVVGVVAIVLWRWQPVSWTRQMSLRLAVPIVVSLGVAGGVVTYGLRQAHRVERAAAYGSNLAWIDTHTSREDVIGYLLLPQKYILAGSWLDRQTRFVRPAATTSQAQWLADLRRQGITLVAIGPALVDWGSAEVIEWLQDETHFTRVLGQNVRDEMVVYQLRPD